jgi:hypothetical protein
VKAAPPAVAPSIGRRLGPIYPQLAVGAATAFAGAVFLQAMVSYSSGQLGPPIDDAYIYFNYARRMTEGALYEYNPGDGVSTGATSVLWTPLLALGYALGFTAERIMLWAFLLGALCLFGYGLLLVRIAERLLDSRPLGVLLGTAIMLEGRVLWGFFSGMEIAPYVLAQVAALYALLRVSETSSGRWLAALSAAVAVMVLVRPEGQFLGLLVLFVFACHRALAVRDERPDTPWVRTLDRRALLCIGAPLLLIVLQYLAFYLATGETSQNGMRTKSHLYAPDANPWSVVTASFKFYRDMIFRHFPWFLHVSLRHVMDLFLLFGLFYGMGREAKRRRPSIFWLLGLWFFVGLGIQSLVLNAAYHHGRYQMNYTFVFWLAFVWGVRVVLTLLPIKRWLQRFVLGGGLMLLLIMMVGTVVHFRSVYGKDVRTIHGQHAAMGRHIDAALPADAAVAMNDAGAIAYLGKRYVYDLFGLTTNVAARWKWLGEACIWEQVQHLDPTGVPRRPDYFAIYDKWYPKLAGSGMLEELASFAAPEKSIAGGPKKTLYRIRWDEHADKTRSASVERGLFGEGARVVDQLDVAYRPDEIAHEYVHRRGGRPSEKGSALLGFYATAGASDAAEVADGGRHITGAESFTVDGLAPGEPVVILRRVSGMTAPTQVSVDGRDAGVWPASSGSSRAFREDRFEIDAELVTHTRARLSFEALESGSGARQGRGGRGSQKRSNKRGYRTYYYWIVHPDRAR